MAKRTKKERTKHDIQYTVWTESVLNKNKVEKKHIGLPVKIASDPNNTKDYVLLSIKKEGDKYFPNGGYLLKHEDYPFGKPVFKEEIICFTPKKRKRKKRKTKTK